MAEKKNRWKVMALIWLCACTAISMNLVAATTVARYTTSANVQATARIAGWRHTLGVTYSNNETARTFFQLNNSVLAAHTRSITYAIPFSITNHSDVTVDYTLYLYGFNTHGVARRDVITPDQPGTTDQNLTAFASFSTIPVVQAGVVRIGTTNTFRVEPGVTANFAVALHPRHQNSTYRCRVFIRAVQVD